MKYQVTIEDWTLYRVEVEAEDEDEAETKAMVLWENEELPLGDGNAGVIDVVEIESPKD